MLEPIISISGLRGIVGTELNPAVASRFTAAFCTEASAGPIVIARDGRISGPMLADAISSTILAHGRDCIDLGVASTPTVGAYTRFTKGAGAIQISASHNPPAYNGMKLFSPEGRILPAEPGTRVLKAYQSGNCIWKGVQDLGSRIRANEPDRFHLELVLATIDVEAIRKKRFRVLLDSNHGSGSVMGVKLLRELGCEVKVLGGVADGNFAHPPEPIADNLVSISPLVASEGFHIGFCQDPDADRLAIIDESGHFIGEEFTAVLCMMRALMRSKGALVTNCASSNMTKWLAEKNRVPFFQSKVGEANVVDVMKEKGALYGGEGSGGPIDPRVGFIRDSFVGMAQVLDLMAAKDESLSTIVAKLPRMVIVKDKMTLSRKKLEQSIGKLMTQMTADSISELDGIRLDWDNRWVLLRASNTEPIVRIIAESPTESQTRDLIQNVKAVIRS